MLVGDLIMNVRSLGPDPCQIMSPPIIDGSTPVTVAGGNLGAGSYFLIATISNAWGETLASNESGPIVVAGPNNAIAVTLRGFPGSFSPTGNYLINIYIGITSGQELSYQTFSNTILNATVNFTNVNTFSGTPPVNSSAFLPDTNGSFVSVATMYRWLNDALKAAARITNGIQDTCGIASVSGMRRYTAPGQWLRFDQCFYDGWELDLGNKAETFRNRNLTANIAISLMVDAQSDTTRIELYWTPSRTSGTTTTNGTLLSSAVNVPINAPTGWLLQDGFVQVGSEIMSYSAQTATQLQNVIRGWNGSRVPDSLASGAAVKELNIELNGYRMPATYSVGDAAMTLGVPPGWEPFLKDYLLGTFREAEQETQEAQGLKQRAAQGLEAWVKSNKPVAGPRQMRMYGDYGLRGTVPGGLTGPLIIP